MLDHSRGRSASSRTSTSCRRSCERRDDLRRSSASWCSTDAKVSTTTLVRASLTELGDRAPTSSPSTPPCSTTGPPAITPDDVATHRLHERHDRPPKGAMLTHGNIMATMRAVTRVVPHRARRSLPVVPAAEPHRRALRQHFGLIARRRRNVVRRQLRHRCRGPRGCRPTSSSPCRGSGRRSARAIVEQRRNTERPAATRVLVDRYLRLGPQGLATSRLARRCPRRTMQAGARRDGRRAIRRQLGLDRARVLVSGAAPIHPDLLALVPRASACRSPRATARPRTAAPRR